MIDPIEMELKELLHAKLVRTETSSLSRSEKNQNKKLREKKNRRLSRRLERYGD